MNWLRIWRRRRQNDDLDDELRAHLRMDIASRIERGAHPADAERDARREFGNDLLIRETTRDMWAWAALEPLAQDLKYAIRRMWWNKGFTLVTVLTLALGIGINTAIFTMVHAVMFNTLPVSQPSELYRLGQGANCCYMAGYQNGQDFALFSYDLYQTLREGTPEIQHLAAFQARPDTVSVRRSGSSDPGHSLRTQYVSSNYFDLFGIRPVLGTFFNPSHELRGTAPALVMSDRAWRTWFGRDPGIIGASLLIAGKAFTVVGITPATFYGETLRGDPPDCWLPAVTESMMEGTNSAYDHRGLMWLYVMGRIPAGTPPRAIEAKVNGEAKRWFLAQAGDRPTPQTIKNINDQFIPLTTASGGVEVMSATYRSGLVLLMILSSLVLLIACANVANLLLARGTAMRAQNSLKLALGASRARMIRQALTDSLTIALLGGVTGLAFAFWATKLILLLAFRGAHYVPIEATPSPVVLTFAIAVSVATGLLFGIAPAWIETHADPADALRGASRSTPGRAILPQKLLVVLQAALSFILLTGSGVLTESLWNLERQDFGFRTDQRVILKVNALVKDYTPEQITAVYRNLQERLSRLPGTVSVSLAAYLPMTFTGRGTHIWLEGAGTASVPGIVAYDRIGPGYFDTLGTRLLQGRSIDDRDLPTTRRVAVVSQAFVNRYCNGRNPIGMRFGGNGPARAADYEIIGVVEDAKYDDSYKPAFPTYFLSLLQPELNPQGSLTGDSIARGIVLHVNRAGQNLEPLLRRTIGQVDSNLEVIEVTSYPDQLALQFNKERLLAMLTQLFGALALALASIGLYGLIALSAARRTAEIGVRMALGASKRSVIAMMLRGALVQVGLGIAIGIPASLAGARLIQHQLFGVSALNPAPMVGATVLLIGCALVAALVPASRATSVDPIQALRVE